MPGFAPRICACFSVFLVLSFSLNVALFRRIQRGAAAPWEERFLVGDVPAVSAPKTGGTLTPSLPANSQSNWTVGFEVEISRIEFVPTAETFAAWGGAHGNLLSKSAENGSEASYSFLKVTVEGRGNEEGPWRTKPEIHTVPVVLGDQQALEQLARDFRKLAASLRRAQEGPTRRRKWGSGRWPHNSAEDCFVFPGTTFDAYMLPKTELKKKAIKNEVYVQYSIGLPLRDVSSVLRPWLRLQAGKGKLSTNAMHEKLLRGVPHASSSLVDPPFGLDPHAFEGFMLLVGHTALSAIIPLTHGNSRQADCAKFYMNQLIVRTHFGDMLRGLTAGIDEVQRGAFFDGYVLPAARELMDLDEVMFKIGVVEYAGLKGVARELGGVASVFETDQQLAELVFQRTRELGREAAESLLDSQVLPVLHIKQRGSWRPLTVRIWLQGLREGKDLMSDHDSWLQGQVIFKNMGKVRSRPGDALVEFRTGFCEHGSRFHSHLQTLEDVPVAVVQLMAKLQKQRLQSDELQKQRLQSDA